VHDFKNVSHRCVTADANSFLLLYIQAEIFINEVRMLSTDWHIALEVTLLGISTVITFVCMSVTILSLLPFNHWICRIWEFPRFQLVCIGLFNVIILLCFNSSYFEPLFLFSLITNLAVIIFHGLWILPYTRIYKKEVLRAQKDCETSLSILTSNVLMTNRNAQKLIEQILYYQPDILVTLESDIWWQQQLDDALTHYPHRIAVPQDNLYGMHVYSQIPLSNMQVRYTVKDSIPSIECEAKLENGVLIKCFFVHPEPPSPTEAKTAKPRDKELLLYADEAKNSNGPVIVTGDLNDVAWSPTTRAFRKQSELYDPRIGRGFFNTFHVYHWWARWPLDHIFLSKHFSLVSIKRLADIGSDHFPLFTRLCLKHEDEQNSALK
jgi:endonuclease/exonuclease/phosphatase (EEP) superfamily protein YafD